MRLRDLCQRGKFSHASVGEKHIDSPFHLADGIVEAIQVGQVRNVSLNAVNVASDYLHGLVQFLLATARDEDKGTFFNEELCRSKAYSFSAARDDCDLSIQLARSGSC